MPMKFEHIPVLYTEVLKDLQIRSDGTYLDGTLGGAGHSSGICERLGENGKLYGCDRDEEAIEASGERLKEYGDRVKTFRCSYSEAVQTLREVGETGVDGILLDLGVSSHQFDTPERGFSYRFDAPLDMRMDRRQNLTAADIVNTFEEKELVRILRDYGEEKFAPRIASNIVKSRAKKPIETTFELNDIIASSIPARMRAKGHPSKQTYQALRIACNDELGILERSLDEMIDFLNPGGRICVITFHSLEDRIVKNIFRRNENPCTCPPNFPQCVCGKVSKGKVITRKPITASEEELENNPRSSSAKLRTFEKKSE